MSAIWTIASMRLSSHELGCETGRWAQVMRVVDTSHFALNKSQSLSIILWDNALPLMIFDHAFHTSSTKPNLCRNFSHNHNVHSRLKHLLVKFLNIETCYSLSHVKYNIFGLRGHIWPPKMIIESIYPSISLFLVITHNYINKCVWKHYTNGTIIEFGHHYKGSRKSWIANR